MTVPEAAVDEYGSLVSREDQIWGAGQALVAHNVSEAQPVKRFAKRELRLGVRTSHTLHERGAALG